MGKDKELLFFTQTRILNCTIFSTAYEVRRLVNGWCHIGEIKNLIYHQPGWNSLDVTSALERVRKIDGLSFPIWLSN